jgi:type III secretion system FlhB-like substrate exporter
MKESEGSPEVKGRIRQVQQQMARQRMMADVPKADVIVTNPTHFAVALKYDDKKMRAPIVVAKGVDLVAARIREIATEHAVPIFEAPPLARVLYKNVDIGGEVPASVYVAVAQVLSYIYQLRTARKCGARPPDRPVVDVEECEEVWWPTGLLVGWTERGRDSWLTGLLVGVKERQGWLGGWLLVGGPSRLLALLCSRSFRSCSAPA